MAIVKLLYVSNRYRDLTQNLKMNVTEVCDYMMENFDEVFDISPEHTQHSSRQKNEIIFSDGESSFGDSSLNQVRSINLSIKCLYLMIKILYIWIKDNDRKPRNALMLYYCSYQKQVLYRMIYQTYIYENKWQLWVLGL